MKCILIGTILSGLLVLLTAFLWIWNSGGFNRMLPEPAVCVRWGSVGVQLEGGRKGYGLLVYTGSNFGPFACSLGKRWHKRWDGGGRFTVFSVLGVTYERNPETWMDEDVVYSPYNALALPYWLVLACAAVCFTWLGRRYLVKRRESAPASDEASPGDGPSGR